MRLWLLALLAALAGAMVLPGSASAQAAVDRFEQCANGSFGDFEQCTGSQWQNGNLNKNNSHYREDDSVPFRAIMRNLQPDTQYTFDIGYDILVSSQGNARFAYDYLTSFDRI